MKYTLFVDESGDQGLDKVRNSVDGKGASPFMTLGGVLVPESIFDSLEADISEMCSVIGKSHLHCNDLNHHQTAYFARILESKRIQLFGVISKKSTLENYKEIISGEDQAQLYYNKCCQYLLELVAQFSNANGLSSDDISIVFESRKHDYERLRNYIKRISEKPLDSRAKSLSQINPSQITDKGKLDEPLLSLADLTAFSLFQSVNESKGNYGIPEERYLRELLPKFHRDDATDVIANHGIKYVKGPITMGLKGHSLKFALKLYG